MAFLRRNLGLILRAAVTGGFLVWLFRSTNWTEVWAIAQGMDAKWALLSFVCLLPALLVTSWRWQILLRVHDLNLTFWRAFELGMVGQFFNSLLIGTTGGDVVKIFYVTRLLPKSRSAAAFTVIEDRVIGLVALLIFGSALSLSDPHLLFSKYDTGLATGVFYSFAAAGVACSLLACAGPWVLSVPRFRKFVFNLPAIHRVEKALIAYEKAAQAFSTNSFALMISFIAHFFMLTSSYCLIRGLPGNLNPPIFAFSAVVAIVNMLIALPTSISGLGVREALFVSFLGLFAIDPATAKAFSFSCFGINLIWSACGGLFYMLYRHETHEGAPSPVDRSLLAESD